MYTVRRACTDTDWYEAAALLYDHVEWMRGFTDFDPVAEQPTLVGELDHFADHYASVDAAVFLAHWRAIAVGTVAIHFHHDGDAELKRMYLRPVARGHRRRSHRRRGGHCRHPRLPHRVAGDRPRSDVAGHRGVPTKRVHPDHGSAADATHGRRRGDGTPDRHRLSLRLIPATDLPAPPCSTIASPPPPTGGVTYALVRCGWSPATGSWPTWSGLSMRVGVW